ncbi:unnamed protein product [Closterium sp. NIES-53]
MMDMKRLSVAAFLLVALAVAARVPSASGAGWVELDLTQTGAAGDAALAQRAAGIALEKYNTQTVIPSPLPPRLLLSLCPHCYPLSRSPPIPPPHPSLFPSPPSTPLPPEFRALPGGGSIRGGLCARRHGVKGCHPRYLHSARAGEHVEEAAEGADGRTAEPPAHPNTPSLSCPSLFPLLLQNSALALAAVQSAEVFVPADVGRKAMIRVAFTASEQEGALRRFLRGPDSTLAVKAEIAGTSHELHHYKLESFRTSG